MRSQKRSVRRDITMGLVVLAMAGAAVAFVVFRESGTAPVAIRLPAVEEGLHVSPPIRFEKPRHVEQVFPATPPAPLPAMKPTEKPAEPTTSVIEAKPAEPKKIGSAPKFAKKGGASGQADGERPLARQALDLVGADPLAEATWFDAINDPQRTAHERSDLIEDLNESGFDDPKNPTADDLPVIQRRLALIEHLAPDAMDDVNAAAFAEAYKDLVSMYGRALND